MRKINALFLVSIIFLSIFVILDFKLNIIKGVEGAATIYVGGAGPGNYSSIGEAIDAASPNDIILVHNGVYYENIFVNITLTIQGESKVDTIIDSLEGTGVTISANNVTFKNFTVRNGSHGILIGGISNLITDNIIRNNPRRGIYVRNDSNIILNNTIIENGNGIDLTWPYDTSIVGNTISDNRIGISVQGATSNSVSENIITNNNWGIMFYQSPENSVKHNIIMANALFDIFISDRDDYHIQANQNYYGTPLEGQIEKRFQGDVQYSNWLDFKDPDAQYLNTTASWNGSITLDKGLIVNDNLTIENATVTFNNSIGQNYILVSGNLTLINSSFKSPKGNFTILYLNQTNGGISDCRFEGQRGLVLQSEQGMGLENNSITRGKNGLMIIGGKYYILSNNKISSNGWSGQYQISDDDTNSSSNSSVRIGIHIITLDGNNLFLESASHNTIRNCEITNSDKNGIYLRSSSNNSISKCNISNNYIGVGLYISNSNTFNDLLITNNYQGVTLTNSENVSINDSLLITNMDKGLEMYEASYNSITNNTVENNGGAGIHLKRDSKENFLSNNTISDNDWRGMYIDQSPRNILTLNKFKNNNESNLKVAEYPIGDSMEQYIDDTNTVNGKHIYYFYKLTEEIVEFLDAGHITIAHSDNVIIQYSNITNGDGVYFVYNTDSVVQYCNISNNLFGVYVQGGSNRTIHKCNFIDNKEQIHEDSTIFHLDDGQIGNYWSDYDGEDADGDWIGDSPYFLKYNFKDNYPSFYPLYLDAPTPTIISVFPSNNEKNVSTISNIYITFSKEMNILSGENGILFYPRINISSLNWINNKTLVISIPQLSVDSTYIVRINPSFKDKNDNPLIIPFLFSFTTEDSPRVLSTNPRRYATDIPLNTSISIIFSKDMNKISVEDSLLISPDIEIQSFEWRNENKSLVIHLSPLKPQTFYIITIDENATDLSGNGLEAYKLKFTTGNKEDGDQVNRLNVIILVLIGLILFIIISFIIVQKKIPPKKKEDHFSPKYDN